jgi:hypothetical protein
VHQKLEATQKSMFSKVGITQDYFQEIYQSLDNIGFTKKEAIVA